ncbi:hypothetical protein Micbo1qcDRAFT_127750 [Microdochium bolleyi]|uniref:Fungal N-terminal domain-containing protein n=1 Tax=Microdochium bolleyi TaxID=196109 RepID=A0A136IKW6_9PEZI|nr:hypothetical protein Micbo1qcDRAFT_127750 [Microdochium bolleyi]
MAELLGIAASVIAVVDVSAKVLNLCSEYVRDVKNAKSDINNLCAEVVQFLAAIEQLNKLLEGPDGEALKALKHLESTLQDALSTLQKFAQDLQPSAWNNLGLRALKWPFRSKGVDGTIQRLARCRGSITLALSVDQT